MGEYFAWSGWELAAECLKIESSSRVLAMEVIFDFWILYLFVLRASLTLASLS